MGLVAVALGAGQARAAGFADPLDLPAAMSPLAARRTLVAVAGAGDRLVAVGPRGHILRSADGGATWAQAPSPVSSDLTAVFMLTPELGWAVGHDAVVLATRDGGASWERQLDARTLRRSRATGGPAAAGAGAVPDASDSLLDVFFEDPRQGWAAGAFGTLLRTEDGGRTWTRCQARAGNPGGLHVYAIRRAGGSLLAAGEQGLLLRLDGTGAARPAIGAPPGGSFFGLVVAGSTAVAFGLGGRAVRSEDGGASWGAVATGVGEPLLAGAALADGRIALLAGSGRLLLSADGGRTFQPVAAPTRPAFALAPAGPGAVALVGPGGVRRERLP